MAIKDLDATENRDGNAGNEQKGGQDVKDGSTKLPGATDIKNAHATGDGSYGRNDESLPEEHGGDVKVESTY